MELYACLVLAGAGVVLLPVLLGAAFLKLGNLANDGIKLGRHLSACSRDPPSSLLANNPDHSQYTRAAKLNDEKNKKMEKSVGFCYLRDYILVCSSIRRSGE